MSDSISIVDHDLSLHVVIRKCDGLVGLAFVCTGVCVWGGGKVGGGP